MSLSRRIAATLAPTAVKRAHERMTTARYLRAIDGPTQEYVERHGLDVLHGPFTGMRYRDDLDAGDLVAKLAGTYECELQPAFGEWIAAGVAHVIDVGCAEGYYAVGLARAMPQATVHAYDIDEAARSRCAALAAHNGVGDRVRIGGECTPATLLSFPEQGVVLLSDCEGYELTLLDPAAAPRLRRWPIVVECHDFLDPSISATIAERFAATHDVEVVPGVAHEAPPELDFLPVATRAQLLSEYRPAAMQWAVLRPR